MTAALLAGVVAGLGVAMPIGAVSTLLAVTAAQRGWRVGAAAGLGAATVDGLYATVALLFGALLAPVLVSWRTPLHRVAAAVLLVIAFTLLRPAWRPAPTPAQLPSAPTSEPTADPPAPTADLSAPAPTADQPAPGSTSAGSPEIGRKSRRSRAKRPSSRRAAGQASRPTPSGALHAYLTFLGLTVVNPTTVVYFAALTTGGAAGAALDGSADRRGTLVGAAFAVGAFVASAAWQLVVAGAGAGAGHVLTGPRGRRWTAIAGGAVVVVLAVRTLLGG